MSPLLSATRICKGFPRHGGRVEVLQGCDLEISPGEAVAITGLSGSGKSTLLNILGGLDHPDSGQLACNGRLLDFGSPRALKRWRSETVGFVFQFHFLLPDFTALENLLIPVRAQREATGDEHQRARDFLAEMGLADRADHLPGELSGGEQQRVAVARAFMNKPRLVLADEPFGNLDRTNGGRLGDLLFDLGTRNGASLVIVTHDRDLAMRAHRRLVLENGILVPGPAPEVLS